MNKVFSFLVIAGFAVVAGFSASTAIAGEFRLNPPNDTFTISLEEWNARTREINRGEYNREKQMRGYDKQNSDLYNCASNDLINLPPALSDETRLKMAQDLVAAKISEIGRVSQKIGGEVTVYFEICGSGFSVTEKKRLEAKIEQAIQTILKEHFNR